MRVIATPESIKIVDIQRQPLARPNPMAEAVEKLLTESKPLFTKDGATIQFNTAKKGQQNERD